MMTGSFATFSKHRWPARLGAASRLLEAILVGAMVATVLFCAARASADAASEARTRYERAIRLYEDAVYDAALVEFTRAYELNPSFKVLYNIAQVRVAMQDYAAALQTFQQYLREGGGQIQEARVASVRQELARLEERVARLNIQSDVSGAEVSVDDVRVGTTPLRGPVLVNSGLRRVTVRAGEHAPQTQLVSVAGGEARSVVLDFASHPTPPAPVAATAAPPPSAIENPPALARPEPEARTARALPTYVVSGVTAGLALTAGSLGIAALVKNRDLKDRRDRPGEKVDTFDDERQRMHRMAIAADVLGLAAIAGVGISTWLWLRSAERPAAARRRVGVALAGTGARLVGEF